MAYIEKILILTNESNWIRRFGYAFVPQYFRSVIFHDRVSQSTISRDKHATAYLSGLKGIAAIMVVRGHFIKAFTKRVWYAYDPSGSNYHVDFPIISVLIYSGGPALLPIFFIVSGYTNSLRFLQLMQVNDVQSQAKMFHMFRSAVPRRFFRLYLPVLAIMTLVAVMAHFGAFTFIERHKDEFVQLEKHPPYVASWFEQATLLFRDWTIMGNFFERKIYYPLHDSHLWTMAWEFRSSVVLYVSLLAVSRASGTGRLVFLVLIAAFTFVCDQWESFCYLSGVTLAQLDVQFPANRSLASATTTTSAPTLEIEDLPTSGHSLTRHASQAALGSLFVLAAWLMSAPTDVPQEAWGYRMLSRFLISPKFCSLPGQIIPIFGDILLLLILRQCSPRSLPMRILNHHFVQYLAGHTFGLYLVHGPWLHFFGYYIPLFVWSFLNRNYLPFWVFGLIIGGVTNLCIVLCLADVWTREVDARCAKAVGTIETYLFPSEKPS